MAHAFEIAASAEGADLFVTAKSNGTVSVWSLARRPRVAEFETLYEIRGRRLAIVETVEPVVVAAGYHEGLAGYDARTGARLWHREDLGRPQFVAPVPAQDAVAVGRERGALETVSAGTGRTLRSWGRAESACFSADGQDVLLNSGDRIACFRSGGSKAAWNHRLGTFALLDAAHSPTGFLVSEATGSLRCLSPEGRVAWEHAPPPGSHVLRVAWNRQLECWAGIEWSYTSGGPMRLVVLDATGNLQLRRDLGCSTPARSRTTVAASSPRPIRCWNCRTARWRGTSAPSTWRSHENRRCSR
ncbi:MAG: hypothetical protein K0Q72_1185 [Armatimonadetes bacterium]|nr:hypothetical protein [Armatimonadota bacterium]